MYGGDTSGKILHGKFKLKLSNIGVDMMRNLLISEFNRDTKFVLFAAENVTEYNT